MESFSTPFISSSSYPHALIWTVDMFLAFCKEVWMCSFKTSSYFSTFYGEPGTATLNLFSRGLLEPPQGVHKRLGEKYEAEELA